jgi:DNA-binding GntR family transcriptional regulator
MPSREPIQIEHEPQRLSDAVFGALHEAILSGKLAPGEWLRQEALARELGVSQITVREALNRLVSEGLCIRVPYKGVRVITLSVQDLKDIYVIRGFLEGLAAESAAGRITEQELARMEELLPVTIVGEDPDSIERAREANREFHEIVIKASGRRFLIQMLKQVWGWIDPLLVYTRLLETEEGKAQIRQWAARDRTQHSRLLKAVKARDGDRARQVVADYVEEAWQNLLSVIDSSSGGEATF